MPRLLAVAPITLRTARAFVLEHHRHHLPPQGGLFAIAAVNETNLIVGVVIVGRPVARLQADGWTAEVTRLATDETPNACSMLYAAAWRAARAMGYRRLLTYTLSKEPGTSLRAAGWRELYTTKARPQGWDTPSRPRIVKAPTEPKTLWEAS